MQQPVRQYWPAGHGAWPVCPHGLWLTGQTCGSEQVPGSVVLPMQSSHCAQGLRQPVTGVHGWHLFVSDNVIELQVPLPLASVEPMKT
jgi:hypothetical protein